MSKALVGRVRKFEEHGEGRKELAYGRCYRCIAFALALAVDEDTPGFWHFTRLDAEI